VEVDLVEPGLQGEHTEIPAEKTTAEVKTSLVLDQDADSCGRAIETRQPQREAAFPVPCRPHIKDGLAGEAGGVRHQIRAPASYTPASF